MKKVFLLFFLSLSIFAKVDQLKYTNPKFQYFNYKEACDFLKKDSTLVEAKNQLYLDCMGQVVSTQEFCHKKFASEKDFVRAFIDTEDHKVVCQFAQRAELTYNCESGESKYCKNVSRGCEMFRKVFAANKKIYHAADLNEQMKCYYE